MSNIDIAKEIFALNKAINKIDGAYYLFSKKRGSNENEIALLYALSDGEPHTQREISREWLIPKTTVNTIVKDMVKKGYVTLEPVPHSKEKHIVMTDRGRAHCDKTLEDIKKRESRALEKVLEQYPTDFINVLSEYARRICREMDKEE